MGLGQPSNLDRNAERPLESGAISEYLLPHRRYKGREEIVESSGRSGWALVARRIHVSQASLDLFLSWTVFLGFLAVFLMKAPGLDYYLTSRDHGYQLCVGTQILMDKVPGIDVIMAYGPMAMYASALGLWVCDSLIGETILCATGYAICLFLIYRLVAAHSSKKMGLAAAGVGFLVQARFYKWYVWLIPLAVAWRSIDT